MRYDQGHTEDIIQVHFEGSILIITCGTYIYIKTKRTKYQHRNM